jgi:hypothetical protein
VLHQEEIEAWDGEEIVETTPNYGFACLYCIVSCMLGAGWTAFQLRFSWPGKEFDCSDHLRT